MWEVSVSQKKIWRQKRSIALKFSCFPEKPCLNFRAPYSVLRTELSTPYWILELGVPLFRISVFSALYIFERKYRYSFFQFRKTLWNACKRFVMSISCISYYQLNWQIAAQRIEDFWRCFESVEGSMEMVRQYNGFS